MNRRVIMGVEQNSQNLDHAVNTSLNLNVVSFYWLLKHCISTFGDNGDVYYNIEIKMYDEIKLIRSTYPGWNPMLDQILLNKSYSPKMLDAIHFLSKSGSIEKIDNLCWRITDKGIQELKTDKERLAPPGIKI